MIGTLKERNFPYHEKFLDNLQNCPTKTPKHFRFERFGSLNLKICDLFEICILLFDA